MIGLSDEEGYTSLQRVLYFFVLLPLNWTAYLYAFLNTKSMKFKDWMIDIMNGYKILGKYNNASLFIFPNKWWARRFEKEDSIWASDSEWSSVHSSIINEYDESSDYMRNYKRHFVNDTFARQTEAND